jgi:hypothetical protein
LYILSSITTFMLTLSPFDIINHLKFDPRDDIEYLDF